MLTGSRTTIAASPNSMAVKMAVYVDGNFLATSANTSISTAWNLKKGRGLRPVGSGAGLMGGTAAGDVGVGSDALALRRPITT